MASYSVAEAKNTLPRLIDRAIEGDKVIITRHGRPVVEIRSLPTMTPEERRARLIEIANRRFDHPPLPMSVLELLHGMDDEQIE